MRQALLALILAGCADKGTVEELRRDNAMLAERVKKLEAQSSATRTNADKVDSVAKPEKAASSSGDDAFISAVDRKIGGIGREVGMKLDAILDEHGRIRDAKALAERLKEKIIKQNGGEESAWRGLTGWLGIPATAAIMNGTVTVTNSGEEVVRPERALAAMEQDLLSNNPGIVAANLGFKLSESIGGDGHLKDSRAICTRIRDWAMPRCSSHTAASSGLRSGRERSAKPRIDT
jgi:hypothetical protein